jgi:hypothetical protein
MEEAQDYHIHIKKRRRRLQLNPERNLCFLAFAKELAQSPKALCEHRNTE